MVGSFEKYQFVPKNNLVVAQSFGSPACVPTLFPFSRSQVQNTIFQAQGHIMFRTRPISKTVRNSQLFTSKNLKCTSLHEQNNIKLIMIRIELQQFYKDQVLQ